MWPRPNPSNKASLNYDTEHFWIHGGPLFFGNDLSAEVTSGCDVSSGLLCNCDVQMDTADDVLIRQTILYHLNIDHAVAEIKELDHLQFQSKFQRRYQDRQSPILIMTDMWGPIRDGGVKSGFFEDKKAWRAWLRAAREVVMEWDGFDEWDWGCFGNVRTMGINKLSQEDFYEFAVRLLMFYIYSFVTRLGYYPSPMHHPPVLINRRCATHKKKFGTGLF